jgi:hypothetical protein
LLLLPNAAPLRALVDGADGSAAYDRAMAGGLRLARAVAHEVRLHLARSLDRVWQVPCAEIGRCHHDAAFDIVIESMRDCAFGKWDPEHGSGRVIALDDPVAKTLADTAAAAIYVARLDAVVANSLGSTPCPNKDVPNECSCISDLNISSAPYGAPKPISGPSDLINRARQHPNKSRKMQDMGAN